MREAFEKAIIESPEERATYSAYSDWLQEQGDPRGEFVAVQLALEDESRSKEDRESLKAREAELLAAHEREWLGELAPFVLDAEPLYGGTRRIEHRFARGWLAELCFGYLTVAEARAFARSPEANLLTRLAVEDPEVEAPAGARQQYVDSYYEPGPDIPAGTDPHDRPALLALAHAPQLGAVRVFRLGDGPTVPEDDGGEYGACHTVGHFAQEVISRMPRLEELYLYAHDVQAEITFSLPLPRLRVLRVEHEMDYALDILAGNPTLTSLTHLLCHPHAQRPDDPRAYISLDDLRAVCRSPHLASLRYLRLRLTEFGDAGVDEVIASGVLRRLGALDLSYGCVTDDGAKRLAACPDLRNLEWLDLSMNAMTEDGIAALIATGVAVNTDRQHGEHPDRMEEDGYLDYLGYGDME